MSGASLLNRKHNVFTAISYKTSQLALQTRLKSPDFLRKRANILIDKIAVREASD